MAIGSMKHGQKERGYAVAVIKTLNTNAYSCHVYLRRKQPRNGNDVQFYVSDLVVSRCVRVCMKDMLGSSGSLCRGDRLHGLCSRD